MSDDNIAGKTAVTSLSFDVLGGRVFAANAASSMLDGLTIELKCDLRSGLLSEGWSVVIGDEEHDVPSIFADDDEADDEDGKGHDRETGWRLGTIPVVLTLYHATEKWLAESAAKHGGTALAGRLEYLPAAADSGPEKLPLATAWIAVGQETMNLVRDRLAKFEPYSFGITLEVLFPPDAPKHENVFGRSIHWDGKDSVDLTKATLVFEAGDWNARYVRKKRLRQPVPEYQPPREHVESLQAISRIERVAASFATPLWLLVVIVGAWAISHWR